MKKAGTKQRTERQNGRGQRSVLSGQSTAALEVELLRRSINRNQEAMDRMADGLARMREKQVGRIRELVNKLMKI